MMCAMAVATQVKSTMNGNCAPKMKFTLESRSGKLSEICAGVSTRTKYEMKSRPSNKEKSDKPINLQNSEKRAHAQVKYDQPIKSMTSQ